MAHVDLLDCVYIYICVCVCVFFNNQDVDFVGENQDVIEKLRFQPSNSPSLMLGSSHPPGPKDPRSTKAHGIFWGPMDNHIPKMHDENGAVVWRLEGWDDCPRKPWLSKSKNTFWNGMDEKNPLASLQGGIFQAENQASDGRFRQDGRCCGMC